MKKLLVPLDFSPCSFNAMENAIEVADHLNMELLLFHSFLVPVVAAEYGAAFSNEALEQAQETAQMHFNHVEDAFPRLSEVPYETLVRGGSLVDNIRLLSSEFDIAMIVMGSHGATGLQRALLGSNAYSIMNNIHIPVIALPENANLKQIKRLGLAGDYKTTPKPEVLNAVKALANAFYAEVRVIHIDQEKNLDSEQLETAKSLEKHLKGVKHSFYFKRDMDVEDGLVEFAKEHEIDLLVMVHHRHNLLERLLHVSETRRIAMDIPMPLMVIQG